MGFRFSMAADLETELEPERSIKVGLAAASCLIISLLLHFELAYVSVFKSFMMMTLYRTYGWTALLQRVLAYTITAALFVALTVVLAGNGLLLLLAIPLVSLPYLYVSGCGVMPMPTAMGGPVVMVPMVLALYDPSAAIAFSLEYFGQALLGVIMSFLVTHAWGQPERDPLWPRPEPTRIWPIDRRQARDALRVTFSLLIGVVVIILFDPPGTFQIAITAIVVATQGSIVTAKRKFVDRFLGCLVGALLGLGAAIVCRRMIVLVMVVGVVSAVLGYLTNKVGDRWYVWFQAGIVFSMVLVSDGPEVTDAVVFSRIAGILIGALIGCSVFLIPWQTLSDTIRRAQGLGSRQSGTESAAPDAGRHD
jgi:hypothetical protein